MSLIFQNELFTYISDIADASIAKKAGFAYDRETRNYVTPFWQLAQKVVRTEEEKRMVLSQVNRAKLKYANSASTHSNIYVPTPQGLTLLPYQKAGIEYCLDTRAALLADPMGLGKTMQAIGLLNVLGTPSVLVVCPASLKLNWAQEINKWATDRPVVALANGSVFPTRVNIVIINYAILTRHKEAIRSRKWGLVILDEVHYLKNSKAQRTKQIFGYDKLPPLPADRVLAMTGTPILNRPKEIFPVLKYLHPKGFSNKSSFVKRYCDGCVMVIIKKFGNTENWQNYIKFTTAKELDQTPVIRMEHFNAYKAAFEPKDMITETYIDDNGASNLDELQLLLRSSIMVRRRKEDVLKDLPPKRHQVLEIDPSRKIKRILVKEIGAVERIMGGVDKKVLKYNEFKTITKTMESGSGYSFEEMSQERREVGECIAPYAIDHLKDCVSSSRKVVCFCHHREVVAQIAEAFAGECVTFTGSTSPRGKDKAIVAFQTDPIITLFIGTSAAYEGINLTASAHVVVVEPPWDPGKYEQLCDRTHRIGQKNSVLCQVITFKGSLISHIYKTMVLKQEVISSAVDIAIDEEVKYLLS